MKRTVLASVTTLFLVLGLVAIGMAFHGDRDGWMWDRHRNDIGSSMMAGGGIGGSMSRTMHHSTVRSEADYLVEMVAHHEEAIEAASQLSRSDRPRMRSLGEAIVGSQSDQVEQMNAWLAAWHPDATDADYEPMMSDLTGLSGDRLDRVFLRDMVGHHMMAVMMSQQLLMSGIAEHEDVAALARTIRDDQRAEIWMMIRWSRAWFGTSPMMGMMASPH